MKMGNTGDRQAEHANQENHNPMVNYSEAEIADLAKKLTYLRHKYIVPRIVQSALDQVFYVVESTRYNSRYEGRSVEWRGLIAVEMYHFYSALEQAIESAKEVERSTGFSGAEILAGLEAE